MQQFLSLSIKRSLEVQVEQTSRWPHGPYANHSSGSAQTAQHSSISLASIFSNKSQNRLNRSRSVRSFVRKLNYNNPEPSADSRCFSSLKFEILYRSDGKNWGKMRNPGSLNTMFLSVHRQKVYVYNKRCGMPMGKLKWVLGQLRLVQLNQLALP